MENFQVGISFVPENRELLAFLKELEKSLGAIQFDGSKVKVADLEKRLSEVSDKASDLLPVFRLLGQEIEGLDGEKFLDFSGAIGDAKKQVANLVSEIEGTEIALPEIDVPKIEVPEIEIPKVSLGDVDVPDIDFDADEIASAIGDAAAESEAFVKAQQRAASAADSVGQKGVASYNALRSSIDQAGKEAGEFAEEVEDATQNLGGGNSLESYFKFEAIQQAGEALSSFAEKGQETAAALAKVQTSAQATGVSVDSLKGAAAELFASKGAESYADALEKIAVANRFLGDTFQGEELAKFTTGLSAVASATGADLEDTIKKSSTFVKGFGVDGKQAYDLLALGSQKAITSGDDFVDVIGEYSSLMKEAGFSAEEFVGTLVKVGKDGTFNLDKVGDAIKETQIRLNAGDIGNAFKDLGDIPPDLGDKLNAALEKATKGQISVKDFLVEATAATNEANLSDAMKTKIQTAISGTPAEEIGHELYGKLFGQKVPVDQIREDAILAGEQVRQSLGDTNIFSDLSAGATVAFENIAASIAPLAAPLGGVLTGVSSIAPAVTLLDGKFGVFTKFGGIFKDIGVKILSLIPALGAQTVATGTATTATAGLNATMLANPALLIVAGIAALVGAFILFSDSTKDVETAVSDANAALDDFQQKTEVEKAAVAQSKSLRDLAAEYDSLKDKADPESQKRFAEVSAELASRVPSSVSAIDNLGTSSEASAKQIAIATNEVRSLADENERLAKEAKAESLENLADQAAALTDSYKAAKEEQAELREERDALLAQEKKFGKDAGSADAFGNPFDTIGDDLRDVRSELGGVSGEVDEAEKGIRDMITRLSEGGKSTEEIAEMMGLTADEVKKFSNESGKAKGAVDATGKAVKTVASETDKAAKKAKELGDKFSAAQKEASEFASTSINALAQSLFDLDAARQKGDKVAIAAAEERVKTDRKAAQEAVKISKGLGKFQEEANIQSGNAARKTAEAVSKEIVNAGEEVKGILDKLNNELAVQAKSELDAELEKLRQSEEAEIASIKAKAEELRKAQKEKGKIVKGADSIKELEEGGKAQLAVEAKYQKQRLDAQNAYYAKLIAQESKGVQDVIAQEISELEFAEAQISGDSEEALKQRLEARLKILSLQQATETRAIVDADAGYIAAYSELQRAIAELDALTLSDATRAERDAAQARVQANRERLAQTESDILKGNRKIALIDRRFEQQTKDAIEDIRAEAYAKKQRELDEDIATSLRKREKELELTAKLIERAISAQEAISGAGIDEDSDEEIKAVERDKELRIITAQEAEERIAEIKKRAERKRLAAQKQAEGARLESERQANLARLEEEKAALEKRLRLAEASGDKRGAEEIRRKLGEVGKEIDEQGSILVAASGEIQDAVTGIFSSLFNDDPEKAKESFRSLFQVLAGGLQRIASAKVTQILFDSILPGLGFSDALLKTVGLKPLIEGLMNALLAPVLQGLLSFPTGGAVSFDKPTLVQVGDGARLGGINREYIFRDDQLRQVIRESSGNLETRISDRILKRIQVAVESIPDKMVVTEEALWGAIQRQAIIRRGKAI